MALTGATLTRPQVDLDQANQQLAGADAQSVIRWAADAFGDRLVMSSSFGAQSAVMLHLVTRVVPDIAVILIDTGYLFHETYRFAEALTDRLGLNLKVYQPELSATHQEALRGREWESDAEGLTRYNQARKVEPMQRALRELNAEAWVAGLRRGQTDHRAGMRVVDKQNGVFKICPILDWTAREVHQYLIDNELPYHPLVEQGYQSIGDTHSTAPVTGDAHERSGRFGGLKQECGLHLPETVQEDESRESSGL